MPKTIAALWCGSFSPIENFGKNNPQMKELESLIRRNLEKLIEHHSEEEQKDIMDRYYDCVSEYVSTCAEQAFCDGFCFGTKLTAEAFCNTTL